MNNNLYNSREILGGGKTATLKFWAQKRKEAVC